MAEEPGTVRLAVPGPARQRRVTVLFRLLMLIPHGIVLEFLAIGAFFTVFVGWWAALFTGRLPQWAQSYLSGFVRWYARVLAYRDPADRRLPAVLPRRRTRVPGAHPRSAQGTPQPP